MNEAPGGCLPIDGLVLAGGKSSRMGSDKAEVLFHGRPMVAIAVETLRAVCATVAIAGNREDLAAYAPVVREEVLEAGPLAGVVAGLGAVRGVWALFVPVDVPLLPAALLRRWGAAVLDREPKGVRLSYLQAGGRAQPTIALLHKDCLLSLAEALQRGDRRLESAFAQAAANCGEGALWVPAVSALMPGGDEALWFGNVNRPEDLSRLEEEEARRSVEGGAIRG